MANGVVEERNLEKQIGCMAGLLQIFDRSQINAGKRLYTAKRLSHSTSLESSHESEKTIGSPPVEGESAKTETENLVPAATENFAPRSPLPLPVMEFKEGTRSSWKFSREAPRLSLDSRAIVDAKGSLHPRETRTNAAILSSSRRSAENVAVADQDGHRDRNRRSPSVIARLMGLESIHNSAPEPLKKSELRRSASESRVNKDLYLPRFVDGNASPPKLSHAKISSNVIVDQNAVTDQDRLSNRRRMDPKMYGKSEQVKAQSRGIGPRKSFFDSADFFPEPKHTTTVYGEIEKRLKMRGIDEPSKDLETLKQILEALQLKGLLHPMKASSQIDQRNFVYDKNSFSQDDFPIVVMKPARFPAPASRSPRFGNESPPPSSTFRSQRPGTPRNGNISGETVQSVSPRRERNPRNQSPSRNVQSQTVRSESSVKSPNRRRPLSIETQRRTNEVVTEPRRVSPVNSPKVTSRRPSVADQRSPRNRKPTVEISRNRDPKANSRAEDESSRMSEITSTDTERAKMEDYKEGKTLLERCDKLLNSIAEITTAELQPSPVSVLDSSFYKDESSTSPIMKRSIEFNDQASELEDEIWESALSSPIDGSIEYFDLIYISEILRASNSMPEDSDVFQLLEKQQYLIGNDTSKASTLQRRLIFDTIAEILSRSWNVVDSSTGQISLRRVWSEFRRIKERDESEDLFEVICGVLKKDLAADAICGWKNSQIEISEAVLDIERLIYKDLIGETIRDLAAISVDKCCVNKPSLSCRKLVF